MAIVLSVIMWPSSASAHPSSTRVLTITDPMPVPSSMAASYCDSIYNLGGTFPVHLYIGGCFINKVKSGNWAVGVTGTVISDILCKRNTACNVSIDLLAFFLHDEISHIADESDQCQGQGVYLHAWGPFFHTYLVC